MLGTSPMQSLAAKVGNFAQDAARSRPAPGLELQLKSAKLDLQNQKIAGMQQEAAERYDNAMSAAAAEMALGVVSAAAGASASAAGVTKAAAANPVLADLHFHSEAPTRRSDATQQAIHSQESKQNAEAVGASDASEAATDRRRAALDNIQKFLDVLRSMNPQI